MPRTERPHNKPRIVELGTVTPLKNGGLAVRGWMVGSCITQCQCHLSPITGAYQILQGSGIGHLGLQSFTPGPPCDCCESWTAEELLNILSDIGFINALTTRDPTEAS